MKKNILGLSLIQVIMGMAGLAGISFLSMELFKQQTLNTKNSFQNQEIVSTVSAAQLALRSEGNCGYNFNSAKNISFPKATIPNNFPIAYDIGIYNEAGTMQKAVLSAGMEIGKNLKLNSVSLSDLVLFNDKLLYANLKMTFEKTGKHVGGKFISKFIPVKLGLLEDPANSSHYLVSYCHSDTDEGKVISEDRTINIGVGKEFTKISDAMNYLKTKSITGSARVILKLDCANVYSESQAIDLNHPDSSQITIKGNDSNPGTCVLISSDPTRAFLLSNGSRFNMITGLVVKPASAGTSAGFEIINNSAITIRNMIIREFQIGARVYGGSSANFNNVTIRYSMHGIHLHQSSSIQVIASRIRDMSNIGIFAQIGSSVFLKGGSAVRSCGTGVMISSGSSAYLLGSTIANSTQYAVHARTNSVVVTDSMSIPNQGVAKFRPAQNTFGAPNTVEAGAVIR